MRHPARLAGSSFLRLQSDERLAELAAAGHDAAFDAIVVRHRGALVKYCGAIVGASRADDAVQQTLLNAHAALGDADRADEVRHVRSWLYRIAHNVSLNLLRGVRDDVSLDADGADALPLRAAAASPSEAFESSEQFRATVAALQALPERQRTALVLRELEGRSHEEIADALGVSAGSARQHLMRGRAAMRAAVTAVTPWGLIVRLAEMASAGGGPGGLETAAAGAGLGAGLAKVTASVMATGALVGGAAVGTHEVVRHDGATPAQADVVRTTASAQAHHAPRTRTTPTETTISLTAPTTRTRTTPHRGGTGEAEHHHRGRSDDHHRGRGRHGSDDDTSPTTSSPLADGHRGRGRGGDDAAEHSTTSSSGSSGHGDGSTSSHSGSGSGSSGDSGRSSGSGKSSDSGSGSGRSSDGSGSGSGRSSGDSGSGRSSGGSGSGRSSGGSGSGRSSGGSGDSLAATPLAPTTTSTSGASGSGTSSGGSGKGGSDDSAIPTTPTSGSGDSGSGESDDDGSSGSGDAD